MDDLPWLFFMTPNPIEWQLNDYPHGFNIFQYSCPDFSSFIADVSSTKVSSCIDFIHDTNNQTSRILTLYGKNTP